MLEWSSSSSHLEKSTIAGVISTSRDFCPTLIQLFSELVAIARIEERPSNIAAEQIVAGVELIRHGIDFGRLHVSQYVVLLRCQVRFAELLVYLLIQKQLD